MLGPARLDRSLPLAASLATNNYDSKNARLRLAKTTVKARKTTQPFGTLIAFARSPLWLLKILKNCYRHRLARPANCATQAALTFAILFSEAEV